MFDLGAKIILVASSCHKKIGPRKDSIGYVTSLFNAHTSIGNKSIFVTPASVKFLCYGNEKRHRFETKQVLLVFPFLNNPIEGSLKAFINIINSDKYINDWSKVRASMSVTDKVPIALAAPIYTPEISFETCTHEELRCWFESCLLSQQTSSFVNKALLSRHPFREEIPCITKHRLTMLREMIMSKQTRHAIMNDMYEDISLRNEWIKTIRMVAIIAEGFEQETIFNMLYEVSATSLYDRDNKGIVLPTEVYKILAPYVFRSKFKAFKNVFVNKKGFPKIIKEMEAIKKLIFALTN